MPFPYNFEFYFEPPAVAHPTVKVQIAFTTAPFVDAPSWTDVSSDVQEIHIRRGRKHEMDREEAGTAKIVLKNSSGDYYPDNTGGSYSPNVKTMKKVNIQFSGDGGSTYLNKYTGYVEAWRPFWRGPQDKAPSIVVACADFLRSLGRFLITDAVGEAAELSGTRFGNILDAFGFPAADRTLDTGQETMQATGAQSNQNQLNQAHLLQESELSIFYMGADGKAVFEDRSHRTLSPHDASVATFGDDAPEGKYHNVKFSMDEGLLYNDVRFTRTGGTEQTSTNSSSQTEYGKRGMSKSGLLNNSDIAVEVLTDFMIARYSDIDGSRVKEIIIKPSRDPGNLFFRVLNTLSISSRITVRLNQAGIDDDYFIEGEQIDWDSFSGEMTVKYLLSEASRQYYTPDAKEETLAPSGAGDVTNITNVVGAATHWEANLTDDADTSYVAMDDAVSDYDLYTMENSTYAAGTINSVTINIRTRKEGASVLSSRIKLKTNGVVYEGDLETNTTSYVTYSKVYTTNPQTSNAWTWAEINAMQCGVYLMGDAPIQNNHTRCTKVWAVVNFTPAW